MTSKHMKELCEAATEFLKSLTVLMNKTTELVEETRAREKNKH